MNQKSLNEVFYNGDRIKEIRKRTGLSQKQFAALYNIPLATYRNWEQGRTEFPDYVFELLHRAVSEDEEMICIDLPEDKNLKQGWKEFYTSYKLNQES